MNAGMFAFSVAVSLLGLWGAVGLVEMILAALLGRWIYREGSAARR